MSTPTHSCNSHVYPPLTSPKAPYRASPEPWLPPLEIAVPGDLFGRLSESTSSTLSQFCCVLAVVGNTDLREGFSWASWRR
ncbi:hypothetical protein CC2G_011619 [Coprinopsis cinerea AmutBmut pab1-1]|nr:hypothetical protein CC2G_011619 [Coprinopsis cinerea AmutBmut pab1-1]